MFLKILRFICRVIVFPICLIFMVLTALLEIIKLDPNWDHWKEQNYFSLSILPWKKL